MLKVSKLADYAVVLLGALAQSGPLMTASSLSLETRLPEPTVAKILKLLAKQDILVSERGTNGGYRLKILPAELSVAEIILAIEGPVSMTACVDGGDGCCDFSAYCHIKGRWDDVNDAIRTSLENISLADMIAPRASQTKAVNQ